MPRPPRYNEAGIYHVINRGVEGRDVFLEKSDYNQFMAILGDLTTKYGVIVHAFCLMTNHYHLILETITDNLSESIKYLNTNYSKYFNQTYERSGHLWQGRFKSFAILNDQQFWTTMKYVERNPIAAGIVKSIDNYPYQSLALYRNRHHPFFYLLHDTKIDSMGLSNYYEFIMTPLASDIIKSLYKVHRVNKDTQDKKHLTLPIESFFSGGLNREESIRVCYDYGYTKSDIAEFLGMTKMKVSRTLTSINFI